MAKRPNNCGVKTISLETRSRSGKAACMQRVVGIDFGARKAGTTVVAWNEGATIRFAQSKEGKDSDLFLRDVVADLSPDLIAIDAPLTLPGVYRDVVGCSDFHLRECDRALKAMSPMFLGGLTARAMALAAAWRAEGITVYETYPRQVAMRLGMDTSEIDADWIQALFRHHGFAVVLPGSKVSKHLLDASLCALPWVCGLGMQAVGKKAEGVIYLPSSPKNRASGGYNRGPGS